MVKYYKDPTIRWYCGCIVLSEIGCEVAEILAGVGETTGLQSAMPDLSEMSAT